MRFDELKIGLSCSITKSFSSEEVEFFSRLSGDNNPLHTNDEYADNGFFGKKIVHGFLTASLFSAIIGTKMPGEGTIYLSQNLSFLKPVYHNQLIVAKVTIKELYPIKHRALLETVCEDTTGEILIQGEALVKITH